LKLFLHSVNPNFIKKIMSNHSSLLGLGTAALGRPTYINIRQKSAGEVSLEAFRQKGKAILDAAYEQGIRYFDTAPNYGLAEQLLIDWAVKKTVASAFQLSNSFNDF